MSSDHASPHVVIIGGFLTEPFQYRSMREALLQRGAARVSVAPVHLPDWGALVFGSMGPLALRGARAIREARRASSAPLIVIGHSLGGIVARLAACDVALDGRRTAVADDIGCLVTLGTPHRFEPLVPWRHAAMKATDHLGLHAPGGCLAPRTGSLTVGSSFVRPADRAPVRSPAQVLPRLLRVLVGETPGVSGDGLIDAERCRLDGVRHIELDDILHGVVIGPWYGDVEAVDRWWPAALEEWRVALEARATADRTETAGRTAPANRSAPEPRSAPAGSWPAGEAALPR